MQILRILKLAICSQNYIDFSRFSIKNPGTL